jgi:hypothetical protein
MTDVRDAILSRLVANDPHGSLDHALTLLAGQAKVAAVGLFDTRSGVELVCGLGIQQPSLDRVRTLWTAERKRLSAGEHVLATTHLLVPLRHERGLALLYAADSQPLDPGAALAAVRGLTAVLSLALGLWDNGQRRFLSNGSIDDYLEVTTQEAVEKRRLVTLLNRNEWNLSRVARILGVSRLTLYKRLRRHEIERLRVRKSKLRLAE